MKRMYNILILVLLTLMLGMKPVSAQIVDEQGQYIDTVFHDSVDRTAEDFVIASLLVADPGRVMYSVLGHSCLRLQCPAFGLDYCFSYESEGVENRVLDFLAGKLMMGLFAISIEDYCAQYREEGRGVYEYKLNLPIEVKRELWRVLDEHLAEGIRLPYDYYHKGCAVTVKEFLDEVLGVDKIVYDSSLYNKTYSVKEVTGRCCKSAWVRFFCYSIAGGREVERPLVGEEQLLVPIDLVYAWQKATVNGEPLLAKEPIVLVEGVPQVSNAWFTPMILAIMLLVLSIFNLFWSHPYFDWLMLVVQTLIGCIVTYLVCFSDLCCTDWNWLIIPFNPLLVIFWYWRRYWALPYVGVLVVWCIAMSAITIFGHVIVVWSHIVLVLAFVVILFKQTNILQHWHHANVAPKYKNS
ncbi:MAG: DUF4105 domain-containing protein [Paludibacteraceae bacterium]|nr:DUF4105 domain-containing protein [Paludibacteraceae bacterium]